MNNNSPLKRAQGLLYLAFLAGVFALLLSVVKNIVTERWLKQKDTVACVPADVESAHPLVYRQTAVNPVNSDAYIKSFVEEYIHLTQNEQIVDYHQVTSNERYQNARLSQARWKALEMSSGGEKALNMDRYNKSNEVFYMLQQGNMGWVFNIDDILLFDVPNTGTTLAVIRGEFQVTYDRVKVDLPPRFWGYREFHLLINQGVPLENLKGDDINKYGLFVTWSNVNILSITEKNQRTKRTSSYYLLEDNKMNSKKEEIIKETE